jgi:hypothetical protein
MKFDAYGVIVVIVLLLIPVQLLLVSHKTSVTADELGMVYQGLRLTRHPELAHEFNRGPFIDYIVGLQFYFRDVTVPPEHLTFVRSNGTAVSPMLFMMYGNDLESVLFWARLPMIFFSIALGLLIFIWARKLYGRQAALLALLLYAFCPNMIGYAGIVSSDFVFAALTIFILFSLWLFFKSPDEFKIIPTGILLGFAIMAKFTAVVLLPVIALFFLIYHFSKRRDILRLSSYFIIMVIVSWFVICLSYGFGGVLRPISESMAHDESMGFVKDPGIWSRDALVAKSPLLGFVLGLPSPLPYEFEKSIGYQILARSSNSGGATLIIDGHLTREWYYYIYSFAVKTPTALLILLLLAAVFASRLRVKPFDEAFLIIPVVVFYLFFSFTSQPQFGYRYMLMTIPLLIIFASKIANLRFPGRTWRVFSSVFILVLCAWFIWSSISVSPHYLSYFNEFIGPDNGYKHFVGANVDWGQDLYYLEDFISESKMGTIGLSYFGFPTAYNLGFPEYYGISNAAIPCERVPGVYAISVTNLWVDSKCYGWLMNEDPLKRIGYSIIVYDIKE